MLESSIHQTRLLASEIAEINIQLRETIARSIQALATPMPDTFLGRPRQSLPFDSADGVH
jgi:hypothetical protein